MEKMMERRKLAYFEGSGFMVDSCPTERRMCFAIRKDGDKPLGRCFYCRGYDLETMKCDCRHNEPESPS